MFFIRNDGQQDRCPENSIHGCVKGGILDELGPDVMDLVIRFGVAYVDLIGRYTDYGAVFFVERGQDVHKLPFSEGLMVEDGEGADRPKNWAGNVSKGVEVASLDDFVKDIEAKDGKEEGI